MRVLDVKGDTEAENESPGKWKGYITASIAAPLERTWQIGSDFSGLHKFVPIIEVCERLKGRNRTPGCLRFYTMNSATGLPGGKRKAWAKDRLLNIDEETHSYTYAVEGSNMHLENCKISFKASDGKDGTIVKWGWELDPIQKSTKEKTLSDMSEFGCTFIKGLEAAAAVADAIDFDFEEMVRTSTTSPMSLMPALGGPKFDDGSDFKYEFEAATAHVPKTYDFESVDSRVESESGHGFKKFEFESLLSPIPTECTLVDVGDVNPGADELVQLEAEVGSLGF